MRRGLQQQQQQQQLLRRRFPAAAAVAAGAAKMEQQAAPKRQRSLLSWVTTSTTSTARALPPSAPASSLASPSPSSSSRGFVDGPPGLLSLDAESHVLYLPGLLKEERGEKDGESFFRRLRGEVEWLRRDVTVFNRTTPQRRLVAYHSCREERLPPYTYSGLTLEPRGATPAVLEALSRLERAAAERCEILVPATRVPSSSSAPSSSLGESAPPPRLFNSCLLNLYRDGGDCMGWHADDEAEYWSSSSSAAPALSSSSRGNKSDVAIASASFGERRDFYLRPKPKPSKGSSRAGEEEQQQRRNHGQQQPPPTKKIRYSLGDGDVLFMLGQTQHRFQHSVPARANVKGERINLTFRWNVRVGGEAPRVVVKRSCSK